MYKLNQVDNGQALTSPSLPSLQSLVAQPNFDSFQNFAPAFGTSPFGSLSLNLEASLTTVNKYAIAGFSISPPETVFYQEDLQPNDPSQLPLALAYSCSGYILQPNNNTLIAGLIVGQTTANDTFDNYSFVPLDLSGIKGNLGLYGVNRHLLQVSDFSRQTFIALVVAAAENTGTVSIGVSLSLGYDLGSTEVLDKHSY